MIVVDYRYLFSVLLIDSEYLHISLQIELHFIDIERQQIDCKIIWDFAVLISDVEDGIKVAVDITICWTISDNNGAQIHMNHIKLPRRV